MVIDLHPLWKRGSLLAVVLVIGGTLAYSSAKFAVAAQLNRSSKPDLSHLAARLEPGNAEYWRRLGLSRQWDVDSGNLPEAIRDLQMASRANPRSADVWLELSDVYQASGDTHRAREAFEKAKANYPISSEVAWRYGNFLLYEGKQSEGYAQIRQALLTDPTIATAAIDECWRSDPHVRPILEKVLPAKTVYYRAAVNYFLAQNQLDPALAVWSWQREKGLAFEMSDSIPLVDSLIAEDRIGEAEQVWNEAVEASGWPRDAGNRDSLVWNGGFEHRFANGGFDWREVDAGGSSFAFDGFGAHSGSRSLRVSFDGTANLDFHHLFQEVSVQPGVHYHFSAFLRSEAISTDSGIGFGVYDPRHPSEIHAVTPELIGTNTWTEVKANLESGPDTHLLRIVLQRRPTWKFDNKLSGTVWVDDVTLTPASEPIQDGWQ